METSNSTHLNDILVTVMATEDKAFGNGLLALRKERGWSQPELGKKVGTSGAIIGRYERGEITPSIDVAKKLADAFGVTLDFLVGDKTVPNILHDQTMLARWQEIDGLEPPERERILSVMDSLVRDAKARQAYRMSA
ncbi:MAG: helix-turn-helix transcriptional regulator [Pseudomonadota bacterium]|nr:helix-turn-helix transcriptional regulator [Pseudomonadota bacterium]